MELLADESGSLCGLDTSRLGTYQPANSDASQVSVPSAARRASRLLPRTSRVPWLDGARGLAIALVVYFHVCMGLWTAGLAFWPMPDSLAGTLFKVMRLPVLLFCSGFLIERSLNGGPVAFIQKKVRRLGVPYVVWSCIQFGLLLFFSGWINSSQWLPDSLWSALIQPFGPLWFLAALLLAQTAYALLRSMGVSPVSLLLAVLVGRAWGWAEPVLSNNSWRCVDALLFVTLGAVAQQIVVQWGGAACPFFKGRRWVAFLTALAASSFAVTSVLLPASTLLLVTFILSLLGVGIGVGTVILLQSTWVAGVLAFLGRHTLEILVAHTIATGGARVVLDKLFGFVDPTLHVVLGLAAGLLLPLALATACRRLKLGWIFGQ